jgi:hypothetical protein
MRKAPKYMSYSRPEPPSDEEVLKEFCEIAPEGWHAKMLNYPCEPARFAVGFACLYRGYDYAHLEFSDPIGSGNALMAMVEHLKKLRPGYRKLDATYRLYCVMDSCLSRMGVCLSARGMTEEFITAMKYIRDNSPEEVDRQIHAAQID